MREVITAGRVTEENIPGSQKLPIGSWSRRRVRLLKQAYEFFTQTPAIVIQKIAMAIFLKISERHKIPIPEISPAILSTHEIK